MSEAMRDESLTKALAERARARAGEQRAIESRLRDEVWPSGVDRIAAALEAQARRESSARAASSARRTLRPRLAWLAVAALPLAAAAAIVLVGREKARMHTEESRSAEYVVSVTGHVDTQRAASDDSFASLQARPDAIQQVLLRPRHRSATALAAKVLVVRDGVGVPVDVATEISEAGVVRIEIPGTLLVGASEVRVAIAPPALLADIAARATHEAAPATASSDVVVVRVPIE